MQNIIKNEPHKLVIFINPPYAEHGNKRVINDSTKVAKISVAQNYKTYIDYSKELGEAKRQLFTQFFIRIYKEISNCTLASFSTLKYINSQNFAKFRETFQAKFLKGFIVPANTFDNVSGKFPIGFLVWNLGDKKDIKKCCVNVFNENNKRIGKKNFYAQDEFISAWLRKFYDKNSKIVAWLILPGVDMSTQSGVYITNKPSQSDIKQHKLAQITLLNLTYFVVYYSVRHSIQHTWINHEDQFLYPKNKWQKDTDFQNDCLAFALFHNKNQIKAKEGINHFIPFSESQVGAKEAFKSDFMVRFINGKLGKDDTAQSLRASKASAASAYKGQAQSKIHKSDSRNEQTLPFDKKEIQANTQSFIPTKPLEFSKEAQEVFSAGLALWRYYHAQAKNSDKYLNDASLYDIKEFFQGRAQSTNGKKGKMNARSEDNHYNDLIAQLRITLQTLADKITPKIYEYEFLLE